MATAGEKGFAEKRYDDLVKEKTVMLTSRDKLLAGGWSTRLAPTLAHNLVICSNQPVDSTTAGM